MLHPFFSTIVKRPDLVLDHLSAYAALLHQEAASAGAELLTRVVAWLMAVMLGVVFLGLAGTALMLGLLQNQFHWVLVAVPGAALLLDTLQNILLPLLLNIDRQRRAGSAQCCLKG